MIFRRLVAAAIGAIVFLLVGFFVENSSADASGGYSFKFYLNNPILFGSYWWLLIGAGVGLGLLYLVDVKR